MKITATFSNGKTISRNTKLPLAYAWRMRDQYNTLTGFTSTKEAAETASRKAADKRLTVLESEVVEIQQA